MAMPATGKPMGLPLWQLDQGQVSNVPSVNVPAMGASETQNVLMFDGRLRPRPGFSLSVVTPPATDPSFDPNGTIVHLGFMVTQSQQYNLLRGQVDVFGNLRIYQFITAGADWVNVAGGPLAYLTGNVVSSAQFGGQWLLCTGSNNLQSWNGAGSLIDVTTAQPNVSLQAPKIPLFLCGTGSRVFLANAIDPNSGNRVPYRVWWSETLDFKIWSNGAGLPEQGSAGYQDLILGHDSSPITGMYFQGASQVIVFKRHSIYRGVYKGGPVWYDFLSVTQSRGCVASASIQCFNDVLIWLGDDYNVYTLDMQGNIRAIGDPIRPRIQQFFNPAFNNGTGVTSALDVVLGLYWLVIPYQDEQTGRVRYKIFVCNLRSGAWTEGLLADVNSAIHSAFWLQPDPPFYITTPVAIWGFGDGNIYTTDYAVPKLVDKQVPFDAWWWSKTYDFLQFNKGAGEVSEFSKISLHGISGMAQPRVRMGKNIPQVNASTFVFNFDAVEQNSTVVEAYQSNTRVDANRFGQMGIYWPPGTTNPMIVDGITVWGIPRQGDSR